VRCDEYLEQVVPYLRGELAPLPRARLESHLAHCRTCAAVERQLSAGLAAARTWEPSPLAPEQLERHLARLSPYLETRSRFRIAALAAATVAAGLLAVGAAWLLRTTPPEADPPTMVFDFSDEVAVDLQPGEPELVRHQPTPHVRLLAPCNWDGRMVRQGHHTVIDMSRGFVAVAFHGGSGRRLRLRTPALQVDVVGTRFLVDVAATRTTVVVSHGRVRVRAAGRVTAISAGEALAFDRRGTPVTATAPPVSRHLEHEFLVELPSLPSPRPRTVSEAPSAPPVAPVAISDVFEQLARAEELASNNQVAAAVAIFESCAEDRREVYAPYRDLCRLQQARLIGFRQGRVAAARALLEPLSGRPGSVAEEATWTLCELDLERAPCRARACLELLAASEELDVRREASQLLERWRLREHPCP
jgi:hypothetical protein